MPGGLAKCFAHFNAKGRNARWSWSALTEDKREVVLTLWKDELRYVGGKPTYTSGTGENLIVWQRKPGNAERLENLKWARDHCGGLFSVVITIAEDVHASPRSIADCYPVDWKMRITSLDEKTGAFEAVLAS